jgi:hypothetical protein
MGGYIIPIGLKLRLLRVEAALASFSTIRFDCRRWLLCSRSGFKNNDRQSIWRGVFTLHNRNLCGGVLQVTGISITHRYLCTRRRAKIGYRPVPVAHQIQNACSKMTLPISNFFSQPAGRRQIGVTSVTENDLGVTSKAMSHGAIPDQSHSYLLLPCMTSI